MKTAETAQPYEWDWDGEYIPSRAPVYQETFSVGIFQYPLTGGHYEHSF